MTPYQQILLNICYTLATFVLLVGVIVLITFLIAGIYFYLKDKGDEFYG